MNDVQISVIVPVYNLQDYVERCVVSILRQTFPHFELLLIVDGATDQSLAVCRRLEKQDERIIVVDKANEGVAATRNLGIQMARGAYVCFIDADDTVAEDYLQLLLDALKAENAQLALCGYAYERAEGAVPSGEPPLQVYHRAEGDLYQKYIRPFYRIDRAANIMGSSCRAIFSRAFLVENAITFPICRICEDQLFMVSALTACHKVAVVNRDLYFYNDMVAGSAVRNLYKKGLLEDQLIYLKELNDRITHLPISDPEKRIVHAYGLLNVRKLVLTNAAMNPDKASRKEEIARIRRSQLYHEKVSAGIYWRWFISQPPKTSVAELLLQLRLYGLLRRLRSK